jgi:hypothetical protein
MRLVVADTGPLNYLVLIGASEVLPTHFDKIVVPRWSARSYASVARRSRCLHVTGRSWHRGSTRSRHSFIDDRIIWRVRPACAPTAVVTAFIARDTFCGDGSSISPLPMAASDGSETLACGAITPGEAATIAGV